MMWRVALATATLVALAETTPAAAQYYGGYGSYDGYGRAPFWDQRPQSRQQWRDDDYGDRGYGGDTRRQPVTRSGGERPAISPVAPPRVAFRTGFPVNSIVIDSEGRMLYYILSPSTAYQYPISVGREGFAWTGTEVISRKQEWPDWIPPKEMIARDPRVPDKMTGGIKNPLGALALYLGNTLYRIHGTNDPKSIGRAASSGCFRMMNEHVLHLASLAAIGTPVAVVKRLPGQAVASRRPTPPAVVQQNNDPYASRGTEREPEDDPYGEPPRYGRYESYGAYDRYGQTNYGRYDRYGGYDGWDGGY
jgi:lipoprotein-anchoring transpeptidase ErfK/SrfK